MYIHEHKPNMEPKKEITFMGNLFLIIGYLILKVAKPLLPCT